VGRAALAIVVTAVLHVGAGPGKYRVNPIWVVPGAYCWYCWPFLIIGDPGRIDRQESPGCGPVTGIVNRVHHSGELVLRRPALIADIVTNNKVFANNASALLLPAGVILATNVIAFGLWYWDLDPRVAPAGPCATTLTRDPAVRFPGDEAHRLRGRPPGYPRFRDYPDASLLDRHRIQPTDVSAVKRWAKLLMILEGACVVALAWARW